MKRYSKTVTQQCRYYEVENIYEYMVSVYINGNTMVLQPANASYPPLTYSLSDLEDVAIEGLAVGFTHWF